MPSTLASKLMSDFRTLIQDTQSPYRYSDAAVIELLNKALRLLTYIKPDAYLLRENLQLVQGSVQTWPDPDARIRQVIRNRGTAGTSEGRTITLVDRRLLEAVDPQFMSATASDETLHWMVDEADPTKFYVYPPQTAIAGQVEILRSTEAPAITASGDTVQVNDRYAVVLPHAMLHFAYSEDDSVEANAALADKHYQFFLTQIGGGI